MFLCWILVKFSYGAKMNTFSWQLIGFKVLTIFLKIQLSSMALLNLKNFLTKLASLLSAVRLCNLENVISAAKFKYLSLFLNRQQNC